MGGGGWVWGGPGAERHQVHHAAAGPLRAGPPRHPGRRHPPPLGRVITRVPDAPARPTGSRAGPDRHPTRTGWSALQSARRRRCPAKIVFPAGPVWPGRRAIPGGGAARADPDTASTIIRVARQQGRLHPVAAALKSSLGRISEPELEIEPNEFFSFFVEAVTVPPVLMRRTTGQGRALLTAAESELGWANLKQLISRLHPCCPESLAHTKEQGRMIRARTFRSIASARWVGRTASSIRHAEDYDGSLNPLHPFAI